MPNAVARTVYRNTLLGISASFQLAQFPDLWNNKRWINKACHSYFQQAWMRRFVIATATWLSLVKFVLLACLCPSLSGRDKLSGLHVHLHYSTVWLNTSSQHNSITIECLEKNLRKLKTQLQDYSLIWLWVFMSRHVTACGRKIKTFWFLGSLAYTRRQFLRTS